MKLNYDSKVILGSAHVEIEDHNLNDISFSKLEEGLLLSTYDYNGNSHSIHEYLTNEEFVKLMSDTIRDLGFTDEVILALSKSKQEEL